MNNRSLNEVDTIILGAGISGLTLGYYLNKREKDFLIFQLSNNRLPKAGTSSFLKEYSDSRAMDNKSIFLEKIKFVKGLD